MTDWGGKLKGDDKEELLEWADLLVAGAMGEYERVLRGANRLRFRLPRYEVGLRVLQIQASFALEQDDLYLKYVDAFQIFSSRNEFVGLLYYNAFREFARLALRVGKYRFLGVGDREKLVQDIEDAATSERIWLLEALQD